MDEQKLLLRVFQCDQEMKFICYTAPSWRDMGQQALRLMEGNRFHRTHLQPFRRAIRRAGVADGFQPPLLASISTSTDINIMNFVDYTCKTYCSRGFSCVAACPAS